MSLCHASNSHTGGFLCGSGINKPSALSGLQMALFKKPWHCGKPGTCSVTTEDHIISLRAQLLSLLSDDKTLDITVLGQGLTISKATHSVSSAPCPILCSWQGTVGPSGQ